ncbi:MAG: ATP-dependent Clp protease ATP-binding subunit, partial [Treponema sp.]|nr:ATP-dependent Clp protease ATP-binding subunit [Treponema sp.]
MFRGLTERAEKILTLEAQNEAKRLNSEQLFPEHIIMSILKEGEGTACKALHFLRIDKEEFYYTLEMELLKKIGSSVFGDVPSSKRARNMLDTAIEEAKYMGNDLIGTEHLMLASLMERVSPITEYMNKKAVSSDAFRVILQTTFSKQQPSAASVSEEFYSFDEYNAHIYNTQKSSHKIKAPTWEQFSPSKDATSPTPTLDEFTR